MTDALFSLCKNASAIGGQGYLERRYYDVVHAKVPAITKETGDEIAARIITKIEAVSE